MSSTIKKKSANRWELKTEPPAVRTRSLITPFTYISAPSSSELARVLLATPPTVFGNDEGGVEFQWDENDISINLQIDEARESGVFHLYHDETKCSELIEFGIQETAKIDLIFSKIIAALGS